MASYSIQASTTQSQTTPVLKRGDIRISADVTVFYRIGENPTATSECAFVRGGDDLILTLPSCGLSVAVLAASQPGHVSVTQINTTKASCSAV